jgi:hypothetical protein
MTLVAVAMCGATLSTGRAFAQGEYLTGIEWPEPPIISPGKTDSEPPSDAVVLFDGKDLTAWNGNWRIEDGAMVATRGDLSSKQSFGDCQLHVEWASPTQVVGTSQGRGNSGVFLMDRYELQVLDSYDNKTYFDGQAGAIYKQTPPLVNAMRKPGEWNSYNIIWTAPVFNEDGSLKSPAYITALHNNVLILNHFALLGTTPFNQPPSYDAHGKLPIKLQYHSNPVRFRNIWVRETTSIEGKRVKPPYQLVRGAETPVNPTPPLPANSK